MAYGTLAKVKTMKSIADTANDSEITDILTDYSDLVDFYIGDNETTPVTNATKLKLLNLALNKIAQGEFEIRHGNREQGASVFNWGWSLIDKYLAKYHGTSRDEQSAKLQLTGTGKSWLHGATADV